MADDLQERDRFIAMMMGQAGIPVPAAEIGKLREMYWGAENARSTLRSIRKGESEPLTVFAQDSGANHE